MNFQKPENAKARALALLEAGNKEDALTLCVGIMSNRKFKNTNTMSIMEDIAIFALTVLVVPQKDLRNGRDILINYRSMTQASNTASLEKVVRAFRTCAEEKVKASLEQSCEVEDLEALDTPAKMMRKAFQPEAARAKEAQERELVENIRFLWESYKQILDVFKTNGKTEDLYNETAVRAFEFCRDHKRTNEFKKVCELLRQNYQNLYKRLQSNGSYPTHAVNPTDPDTIRRTIDTRCRQLQIAGEMELWKECFNTAEDLHLLMMKRKPKPQILAQYYDFLRQICWKSQSFLFHAYACVRNYSLYKVNNKALTKEQKLELASVAVLATMCVSQEGGNNVEISGREQVEMEKMRRMATLFNVAAIPSKSTLKTDLVSREILIEASEPVRKLYEKIENAPQSPSGGYLYPKDLCFQCKTLLDQIATVPAFANYTEQLSKVVFLRLLGQLSKSYSALKVSQLRDLVQPIVDFPTAEKWMISSAKDLGIHVQVDYVRSVVVFANKVSNDLSTLKQPLLNVAKTLFDNLSMVYPNLENERKSFQRSALFVDVKEKLQQEKDDIERRIQEISRRNSEKQQFEEERQAATQVELAQKRAIEAKEAKQASIREKEKRAEEAAKKRQNESQKKKVLEIIDDMKVKYSESNPKIGDYMLNEITEAEVEKLDLEFVETERSRIITRDRQEKIRHRKMESRRIDHLSRALREQQAKKIPEEAEMIREKQQKIQEETEREAIEEAKQEHKALLGIKQKILASSKGIHIWLQEHIGKKELEYGEKIRQQQKESWDKKCKRAVKRFYEEEARKEEERARKEAEEIQRQEEEAREEARLEKEREQEERRKQMEEERRKQEEQRNNDQQKWRQDDAGGRDVKSSGKGRFNNPSDRKDDNRFGGDRDNKFNDRKGDRKGGDRDRKNDFGGNAQMADDWRGQMGQQRDIGRDNRGKGGKDRDGKGKKGQREDRDFGALGALRNERAPPSESNGAPAEVRPEPLWKKYAREKKEQEQAAGGN